MKYNIKAAPLIVLMMFIGCHSNIDSTSKIDVEDNQSMKEINENSTNDDLAHAQIAIDNEESFENGNNQFDKKLCVNAKSGLIYRENPDGKALGKFEYGSQLKIVEYTGQSLTINDLGKQVIGEWLGVLTQINGKITKVYVFGGFLEPCFEGDIPVNLIRKVSKPILERNEKKVVLFPRNSNEIITYGHEYKPNGSIRVPNITYVQQLAISAIEHPLKSKDDYCDYAKFVKILYNEKEYIVFGTDVYRIDDVQKVNYKNKKLNILRVINYAMGIADEQGLTFCSNGNALVLIDDNNRIYSIGENVLLTYVNDDMQSEIEGKYEVVGDSIKTDVHLNYTDEEKVYTLSIYENNGWNFKIDNIRAVQD